MSSDLRKVTASVLVVALCGALGWLLVRSAAQNARDDAGTAAGSATDPRPRAIYDRPNPASKLDRDPRSLRAVDDPRGEGLPGERIVLFDSDEDYERFLASLDGSGVRLLGRIDRLRALRLGFDDLDALNDLLGDQDSFANFPVFVPTPPEDSGSFTGGAGFGTALFEWLGVPPNNESYGRNIRVAMIDTGVGPESRLSGIQQVDLLAEQSGEAGEFHGHGENMLSILLGDGSRLPGLAPAAEAVSYRIGDETGFANSFLLADAILRAVDDGAQIINISMGSDNASGLVSQAVEYAAENDVLIVASAGNSGLDTLSHPASHESVIAVGAVDANANHASFSNMGDPLTLAAPGVEIPAVAGDSYVWSTGTSPSAMVVTALTVAAASELGLSIPDAYERLAGNLNEAGAPGDDPLYGGGYPDFGRVLNSETAGIHDIALASPYYRPATAEDPYDALLFTVENRGTEPVSNIILELDSELGTRPYSIGSLQPDEIETVAVTIPSNLDSLDIAAEVTIPANLTDQSQANNRVAGTLSRSTTTPAPARAAPLTRDP